MSNQTVTPEKSNLILGGWSPFKALTEEDETVWKETPKPIGVDYTPYEISMQVVAGINYRFKCKTTIPGSPYSGSEAIVEIFKPLKGKPYITNIIPSNSSNVFGIVAQYYFYTPSSINANSGTLNLTIIANDSYQEEKASGKISIQSLLGLGTRTEIEFSELPTSFNSSTGYTTVKGKAKGTYRDGFNQPEKIEAEITISLHPGFKDGNLTVNGFLENIPIKADYVHYLNENS